MAEVDDSGPVGKPKSLGQMDKAYLWHPFTPMRQWIAGEPLVIEAGEGFELIDAEGNRYIDGFSTLWCNLHGHRVARIDAAIRAQRERACTEHVEYPGARPVRRQRGGDDDVGVEHRPHRAARLSRRTSAMTASTSAMSMRSRPSAVAFALMRPTAA